MQQHDLAWHWDSSLYLALVPKEIPTPKDFNKNNFKMELNHIYKNVTFLRTKRILSLWGKHMKLEVANSVG